MKSNLHNRQFLSRRADQSALAKSNAAERFRNYHVDLALKRILKACEQKEINPNPPSPESGCTTQAPVADQAGKA